MKLMNLQDIKIIKSRRKTISLSVKRGKVIVRAPYGTANDYIFEFISRHSAWIEKQLAKPVAAKLVLDDGALLTLFGEIYCIESGRTRVTKGVIYLPQEGREAALTRLLKKLALEKMSALTEQIAKRFGFEYSGIRISSARGRWGSCSQKRSISYSFRMAFLSPALCEYVAVHELCHTLCFNHSKDFWTIVERALPDWKIRRKMLKNSPAMSYL